jgi:putative transposase
LITFSAERGTVTCVPHILISFSEIKHALVKLHGYGTHCSCSHATVAASITQRGNKRQTVFYKDHDREMYLKLLGKHNVLYHLELIGFALMGNHVHDISVPEFETSLAKGIGRTDNDYSRWLNIRCNRTGHLWQARFYSCPIQLPSLADVLAYVELNPVRAGLVEKPEDWAWSSAHAHLTGIDESGLLNMDLWSKQFTPESWADYLSKKMHDRKMLHRIRNATQTG